MRPVITSDKRIVQSVTFPVMLGTTETIVAIDCKSVTDQAVAADVTVGTVIKAIYLEYWIVSAANNHGNVMLAVEKVPASAAGIVFADSQSMSFYNNKKNVLYMTQGLTNDANADAIPFLRQWIKIPKGKQRFGNGDRLNISITSISTSDIEVCGFALYKAYT